MYFITKTYLYNFDPLKPHFYIVKLEFTGVYIIFIISALNIDCGYSLEPPLRGGSNEYPQSMFWADIWKISEYFYLKIFLFLEVTFSLYLKVCFRNVDMVLLADTNIDTNMLTATHNFINMSAIYLLQNLTIIYVMSRGKHVLYFISS